jgi:hypothetical protein
MNVIDLLKAINSHLDDLEAAIKAMDLSPQLVELDTRIQALAGQVRASVTSSEPQ